MDNQPKFGDRRMHLRYAGHCRLCGAELGRGVEAIYEPTTKTVRCIEHAADDADAVEPGQFEDVVAGHEQSSADVGRPGASARREFERRTLKRAAGIRAAHPKLGGLILALSGDPQSTRAWGVGAIGEERLGARLTELSSDTQRVLHDRRIPGSRANIDHLVVARSGVFVIDAKRYKGRPALKIEGGMVRPRVEKLMVGTRDCTEIVDGVVKQVGVVRRIVGAEVPVLGVLCFVEADWPLIGGAFSTRSVDVLWPRRLYPKLSAPGPLSIDLIGTIHGRVAAALPRA